MSGNVRSSCLIIGIGNEWRGDDAAGRIVARKLRERLHPNEVTIMESAGDGASLMADWTGFTRVLLLDTVQSGAEPGSLLRLDLTEEPLPARLASGSTHLLGVAEAVELARALGKLPAHLTFLGIEGSRFEMGAPLSEAVAGRLDEWLTEIVSWATNGN